MKKTMRASKAKRRLALRRACVTPRTQMRLAVREVLSEMAEMADMNDTEIPSLMWRVFDLAAFKGRPQ